jgi:hypothetical protein
MGIFNSQIPFFLESFLSKPASALPKGAQWCLVFEGGDGYSNIIPTDAIKTGVSLEPKKWEIEKSIDVTLSPDYQTVKGCMFVQAVSIPGESNQINPEGLQVNGFIRSNVGGGRDTFPVLSMVFLETNVSFVDMVIRPWVIATSHLGMIARKGADNYRCNISVYKLGVYNRSTPPFVLQKFTFFGACPISVSGEEYNYTQTSSPINRETSFTYHYYNVENMQSQNLTLRKQHSFKWSSGGSVDVLE